MTVSQLKVLLSNLPGEAKVLLQVSDHRLILADVKSGTAFDDGKGVYTQDFGENLTPEVHYGQRIKALVIG